MDHTKAGYLLPALYLMPLKSLCGERLIDLPRLLMQQNIDPGVLQRPDEYIDYLSFVRVLNRAAALSRDNCFGHRVGKALNIEEGGALGALLRAQDCIANIYPVLAYLFAVQLRGTRHDLLLDGELASHCIEYLVADQVSCDHLAQLTLSGYHVAFRRVLGSHWKPSRVTFTQPPNDGQRELEVFFGCPVQFSATKDAIEFPRSLLYQPTRAAGEQTPAMKRELAQVLDNCDDLGQLVGQYIEFQLRDGSCNKSTVAKALGVHPKVLQKCLAQRQITYQSVLAKVRRRLATEQLATTDLSIADIAQQMGFSDSRAFIRAFKTWFDTTPMQWRTNNFRQQ